MFLPSTVITPEVGVIMRLIILIEVVLPQPDGPTKTVNDWGSITRSSESTAVVPSGYVLFTLSKVITTGVPLVGAPANRR